MTTTHQIPIEVARAAADTILRIAGCECEDLRYDEAAAAIAEMRGLLAAERERGASIAEEMGRHDIAIQIRGEI